MTTKVLGISYNFILLEWNVLEYPVIWLVNQARDMIPYPRCRTGDMDSYFGKMAYLDHRFIFLLILKKKLQ